MMVKKNNNWEYAEDVYFSDEQSLEITGNINHKLEREYRDWTEYHVFYNIKSQTYQIEFKNIEFYRGGYTNRYALAYFNQYILHMDRANVFEKMLIAAKQFVDKHDGQSVQEIDQCLLTHQPNPHQIERQSVLSFPMKERINFNMQEPYSIFSLAVGVNVAIQRLFNQSLDPYDHYHVDLDQGKLWLGDKEYDCEFIGSYSKKTDTWMWGFNNINHFNESHLNIVNAIKQMGKEWNNPYFQDSRPVPMYNLGEEYCFREYYAAIVSGIQSRPMPYYKMDQGDGVAYVLITNADEKLFQPIDADSVLEILTYIHYYADDIDMDNVNFEFIVEGLLRWNGTPYEWKDEKTLIAHLDKDIEVGFFKDTYKDGDYDLTYRYSYILGE